MSVRLQEGPLDLVALSELRRAARSGVARRARQLAGVSQGELARALGVTPASISYYERGRRQPSPRVAGPYLATLCGWAESLRGSDDAAIEELRRTAKLLDAMSTGRRQ